MSQQKIKKNFLNRKYLRSNLYFHLSSCFVVLLVFIISLILAHYYVGGDQSSYISVYNTVANLSFIEGRTHYVKYLTSHELIHFILVYIFSIFTEKFIFIAIFNSILAYSILILFRQWEVNFLVSANSSFKLLSICALYSCGKT